MVLFIDSSNAKLIKVALKKDGEILDELKKETSYGSQVLLGLIQKILKKNILEFKDLSEIKINTGPGSYTGLKVGAAVANALGFSLGIPVNNKKVELDIKY